MGGLEQQIVKHEAGKGDDMQSGDSLRQPLRVFSESTKTCGLREEAFHLLALRQ